MTALAPAAAVVAANPGPAVHLAALAIVLLVGLATYGVMRWRRRRSHTPNENAVPKDTTIRPHVRGPRHRARSEIKRQGGCK